MAGNATAAVFYTDSVGRWRHYEKHLREQHIISSGD